MGAPRPMPPEMIDAIHRLYELKGVPGVRAEMEGKHQHITDGQIWSYARRRGMRRMRGNTSPAQCWEDADIRKFYPELGAAGTRNAMLQKWDDRGEVPRTVKFIATRASLIGLGREELAVKRNAERLSFSRPAGIDELLDVSNAAS